MANILRGKGGSRETEVAVVPIQVRHGGELTGWCFAFKARARSSIGKVCIREKQPFRADATLRLSRGSIG